MHTAPTAAPLAPPQPRAHTPGPWYWNGRHLEPVRKDPDAGAVHTILADESGYGYVTSPGKATLAELDADRALIKEAPRLLEALVTLRDAAAIALEGSAALAYADLAIALALPPSPTQWAAS